MKKTILKNLPNFENREERKEFIDRIESGIYEGLNIDGDKVYVIVEKGRGMDIKTCHKEKPKWFEVVEYDENGFQVSLSYEPVKA